MSVKSLILALLLVSAFARGVAEAQAAPGASDWVDNAPARVRLIAARSGVTAPIVLGLHMQLEPGWKLYWRHPGEGGLPPSFDWTGSENLGPVVVRWPAPRRLNIAGAENFVYLDEVVLPLMVQPRQSGQPLKLRLKLDYGICREICIPYRTDLALDLTAGAAAPTVFADLIARYDARVPIAAAQAGVTIEQTREIVAGGKRVLEVAVRARSPLRAPDLIVEGPPPFWFGTPQVSLSEGGGKALFLVPIETGRLSAALAGTSLGLTLLDGERAVETQIIFGR